jgi:hypothetical protein
VVPGCHPMERPRDARVRVVHQPQPLPFRIGEADERPSVSLLDVRVLHAELGEALHPELERVPARYPQLRRGDFASARVVRGDPQVRPVEENDLDHLLILLTKRKRG